MSIRDYSYYPISADVAGILTAAGYTVGDEDVAGAVISAAAWWEDVTGFSPFLVGAADAVTTRQFQVYDRNVITFDGGLIVTQAIPATAAAGTYDQNGVAVNTVAYTNNVHFRYKPDNAVARNRPYTYLQITPWYWQRLQQQRSVVWAPIIFSLTGLWGHSTTLSADVWQAIAQRGAALALTVSQSGRASYVTSRSQEGVSEAFKYGLVQQDLIEKWHAQSEAVAKLYTRNTV